ncbi:MAG TPA: AMP-binding protein [Ramlibacter sp.]|nr:AMP-binding protein [Ramlibacter sp.]
MNILDPIHRQVRAWPDRIAVIDQGRPVSYARLWRKAAIVAAHLRNAGVKPGECVAVSGLSLQSHLVVVMGLARLGAVSTSVQGGPLDEPRRELFARNQVVAWVGGTDNAAPGVKAIPVADLAKPLPEDGSAPPLAPEVQDRMWRIALSSGTTGASKSIPFTHAQAALLQRLSLDAYPTGPGERMLVLADLRIGFALGHCMQQLAAGATVVFPQSLEGPEMIAAIRRDAPTRILSTPAICTVLVNHIRKLPATQPFQASGLLSVMLGGSIVTPAQRAEVERHLCPNLVVVYGSTEMGSTARNDSSTALEHAGTAGRLLPWVEGEAVDESGAPLPAGETGRLRFRSPAMATGYLGDPQASEAAFRDGWYYPGDKGSIDAGGNLRLGGRTDDVINLQGVKVDPARIEAVLDSHPSVRESAVTVVARSSRRPLLAMLVIAADESAPPQEAELKTLLREKLGALPEPSRVQVVTSLPRNAAGKLARGKLPALVAASGTLPAQDEQST